MFVFNLIVFKPGRTCDCWFERDLLHSKFSFAEFVSRYVFRRSVPQARQVTQAPSCLLFPKLEDAEIINLNNSIRGMAKVCAADDLELSLNGGYDEFDFLDASYPLNSSIDQFEDRPHLNRGIMTMLPASEWDERVKLERSSHSTFGYNSTSNTLSLSSSLPLEAAGVSHNSITKVQAPFVQIQSQPLPQPYIHPEELANQSHFALNMIGLNSHLAFNDFGYSNSQLASLPLYSSSSDSNGSPLDEMFLKDTFELKVPKGPSLGFITPKNLKRKFNDYTPSSDASSCQTTEQLTLEPASQRISHAVKKVKIEQFNLGFEQMSESETHSSGDEELKYKCDQCDSKFKVKSYLTRHRRKHNNANAFVCPFFEAEDLQDTKSGTRCHHTGGFSRRDTYKTHLKALHFIYPPGTRSSDRTTISGRCAGCFDYFENNATWLKSHIEGNQCKGVVGRNRTMASRQQDIKQEPKDF